MNSKQQTIGTLNGPWKLLLKVQLATMPVFIAVAISWAGWVSLAIVKLEPHRPRLTKSEAMNMIKAESESLEHYVSDNFVRRSK